MSDPTARPVEPPDADYCGCCGHEIRNRTNHIVMWCAHCKPHIRRTPDRPPWERTYESITGQPCPFQVGSADA